MSPAWAIVLVPQSVHPESKPDFLHHFLITHWGADSTPGSDRKPSINFEVLPISKYSELSFRKQSPITVEVLGVNDC